MKGFRSGLLTVVAVVIAAGVYSPAHAALTDTELSCSAAIAKNYAKFQTSALKLYDRCHRDDISGKLDNADGCDTLDAKAQAELDKAKSKFISTVANACHSNCSISLDIECVSDLTCPPLHLASPPNNFIAERCIGKAGAKPFDLAKLDWPGPYCSSVLGHRIETAADLGECIAKLADKVIEAVDQAVYADLDEGAALSKDALKCAGKISKSVQRAAGRAYLPVAVCRDARRSANLLSNPPWKCSIDDVDAIAKMDKEIGKMVSSIGKSCDDAAIAAIGDLCEAGGTPVTTVAGATACFEDLVREISTQERGLNRHVWSNVGMLNITHPNSAYGYCGDGVVTAKREEHTGVGEECDGDSDDDCGAGSCYPPGDLFECTCDTVARERYVVAGGPNVDSDAGWKGASHDATHNQGFGYVTELSNCDCDNFSQADCVGSTSDPICDVYGNMAPRCSDDLSNGSPSCDQRGNNNGVGDNSDCFTCDDNSINAGTWCANGSNPNETLCQSQCFDNNTGLPVVPQTPCLNQAECGEGQTCKGRCDNSIVCNRMTEGTPLPQVSAAISVCLILEYKSDIVGTKNMVTGESSVAYTTRNLIQLGSTFTVPCPVCGGVCVGGAGNGSTCSGRCDASNAACVVDSDCTGMGDTACLESAADCTGGYCSLDLRCSAGANSGDLCRPESSTPLGLVSHDCLPDPAGNISGSGVLQPFAAVTTGVVQHVVGGACTDPSWTNFECPCPADAGMITGVPTQPSGCAAACDGGANAGQGCVTGSGGVGVYTRCVGGAEAGAVCDEDTDCSGGGTCSGNPTQCSAGTPSLLGTACVTNANCGSGGVCSDACPGARCVPLCSQQGACNGGGRDGDACASERDCRECTAGNPNRLGQPCLQHSGCNMSFNSGDGVCSTAGGVTCDVSDPEDGLCTAGPTKLRCTGAGYTTLPCSLDAGTCSGSTCTSGSASLVGSPCTNGSQCVVNNVPVSKGCSAGNNGEPGDGDDNPGAGTCEPRPEDCFFNGGYAEGGTTLNGDGSPSNVAINAVFCVPPVGLSAINEVSGFGGPSRTRRGGSAFVNVPSIP